MRVNGGSNRGYLLRTFYIQQNKHDFNYQTTDLLKLNYSPFKKKIFFSSEVTPNSSNTSSNLEASDSLPTAEDCMAADTSLEAPQKAAGKTTKEAEEASSKDGVQDIETNKGEKSKVVKYIFIYQRGPANIFLFDL